MKIIIGLIIMALGVYVGAWLLFVGGIIQFIDAIKATPVEAYGLAVGFLKFWVSGFVGWLTFLIGTVVLTSD